MTLLEKFFRVAVRRGLSRLLQQVNETVAGIGGDGNFLTNLSVYRMLFASWRFPSPPHILLAISQYKREGSKVIITHPAHC